jgi:hypothetical protein
MVNLFHEIFYRLRPFCRIIASDTLNPKFFLLLGENELFLCLCFFPVEEFKSGIISISCNSRIELLKARSDTSNYLFIFKFKILIGFFEKFIVGDILEISELVVLEG